MLFIVCSFRVHSFIILIMRKVGKWENEGYFLPLYIAVYIKIKNISHM